MPSKKVQPPLKHKIKVIKKTDFFFLLWMTLHSVLIKTIKVVTCDPIFIGNRIRLNYIHNNKLISKEEPRKHKEIKLWKSMCFIRKTKEKNDFYFTFILIKICIIYLKMITF